MTRFLFVKWFALSPKIRIIVVWASQHHQRSHPTQPTWKYTYNPDQTTQLAFLDSKLQICMLMYVEETEKSWTMNAKMENGKVLSRWSIFCCGKNQWQNAFRRLSSYHWKVDTLFYMTITSENTSSYFEPTLENSHCSNLVCLSLFVCLKADNMMWITWIGK